MKKYFILCLFITASLSCNSISEGKRTNAEYAIISYLYDSLSKRTPSPPPILNNISTNDSISIMNEFQKISDSLQSVKPIVAVNPIMRSVALDPKDFSEDQRILVEQLISLKQEKLLNIKKIKTSRSDSIVKFEQKYLREFSADYREIDKLISFSRIAFNKNNTEAAIVASMGTSRLASFSAIYFFRKVNEKWIQVDSKGISIS